MRYYQVLAVLKNGETLPIGYVLVTAQMFGKVTIKLRINYNIIIK